jgi:hypothetical protein
MQNIIIPKDTAVIVFFVESLVSRDNPVEKSLRCPETSNAGCQPTITYKTVR